MIPIDKADTAFVLMSAALVMFMTPGLAIFYAGMVRAKNALGTIMQSFILIGFISLEWVYLGTPFPSARTWGASSAISPGSASDRCPRPPTRPTAPPSPTWSSPCSSACSR